MRKLFLMFAVVAMSMAASAQSTRVIKGAVIDKNGNPLPGATVEATGGSEVTTVDADGTFSMEVPAWLKKATARYAGMRDNTMKVKDGDMLFKMKNGSKKQWYLMANYSHSFGDYSSANTGGVMFGTLNKWGWYVKINAGKMSGTRSYESSRPVWNGSDIYYEPYTETYDRSEVVGNLTVGVSKRIIKPLHAYVGFGVGSVAYEYWRYGNRRVGSDFGLLPEIGLIGHFFNHLVVNFSYSPSVALDCDGVSHTIQVGAGYAF